MTRLAADRDRVEPGPTPFPRGAPPAYLMSREPGPPIGFELRRAVATTRGWMAPCPCCLVGWVPVLPDGSRFGYRLDPAIGCSGDFAEPGWPDNGCSPSAVAWWAAWRAGDLPPLPAPDDRQRAYARGVIRNCLADALEGKNPYAAGHRSGQFMEAAGFKPDALAGAFLASSPGKVALPHFVWIMW
jgi:hypothetical protein